MSLNLSYMLIYAFLAISVFNLFVTSLIIILPFKLFRWIKTSNMFLLQILVGDIIVFIVCMTIMFF